MPRALIAGLGLIGGSIGHALRARGWHVQYFDPFVHDPRGAANERVAMFLPADVTVLATPVDVAVGQLPLVQGLGTSVCSVMAPFRSIVAGHPMAGSEARGIEAARGDLFVGKRWFVDGAHPLVDQLIADCGAVAERVDAEEHDRAVAMTSHLPQLLSTALGAYLADREDVLRFAGEGLRTFLRLAGSDASVWRPIFDANYANIDPDEVARIARAVLDGDDEAFRKAQSVFARLYHPRA